MWKPESEEVKVITPEELEKERVTSAVRTDIILSAEIMAIAYSQVRGQAIVNQIVVMLAVAVFITVAVYGFVGLIVKADDIGVHLAQDKNSPAIQKFGRGIVKFMPHFLKYSGVCRYGSHALGRCRNHCPWHSVYQSFTARLEHALAKMPAVAWFAKALACAIAGLIIGFVV
jgi:predicted DNA repair protein MutK